MEQKIDLLKSNLEKAIKNNKIPVEEEAITKHLASLLGRDKVGSHAEVKAVSNLMAKLDVWETNQDDESLSYSMNEILVAVIRTSKMGDQQIGYEFIRCPNCTLVLNMMDIVPLTDNQDYLKEGKPVKKT